MKNSSYIISKLIIFQHCHIILRLKNHVSFQKKLQKKIETEIKNYRENDF